jgi:hypothetical protein
MGRDDLYDGIVYFSFGIEKLCKAVVHDVSPVLLLEAQSPDNAIGVLFRDRLLPAARHLVDKRKPNPNLIPFQASMLLAAKFCQAVEDNVGAFTLLADYRGAVAHRSIEDMDAEEAAMFLRRVFFPTVEKLAEELEFESDECYDSQEEKGQLQAWSVRLAEDANVPARVQELLAAHRKIWDSRKDDPGMVEVARHYTKSTLENFRPGGPYSHGAPCPACGQQAIILYKFAGKHDYEEDSYVTTGMYAVGLCCRFCDLYTEDYAEIDYLKLNDLLQSSAASN